jgi:hypothetical protein
MHPPSLDAHAQAILAEQAAEKAGLEAAASKKIKSSNKGAKGGKSDAGGGGKDGKKDSVGDKKDGDGADGADGAGGAALKAVMIDNATVRLAEMRFLQCNRHLHKPAYWERHNCPMFALLRQLVPEGP